MPISTTDQLFVLVKGLNKAEKRNFKLYAKRTQQTTDAKFIRLFDALDQMDEYSEEIILRKLEGISKGKLSNLKRHLYSQLLSSLRLIHKRKNVDIQIREQIDFARILYGKGLYMQSLKLLNRIKGIAKDANQDTLHYEILEFEKLIEEKHITRSRSIKNKVENLIDESEERIRIIGNSNRLTNLKLKIHGLYIKVGHAKSENDAFIVRDYFKSNLPDVKYTSLTFFEKVYLHQSYVWYYYILLDFEKCADHALKWVELYLSNEKMIEEDPDIYMRGVHYLLTSLYAMGNVAEHRRHLEKFEILWEKYGEHMNTTSKIIHFLYYYSGMLNKHFLEGTLEEGIEHLVPELESKIALYDRNLDLHRILVFYYRTAWMYFGAGRFGEAIDYLNKIINLKVGHLREDIQCYARLLHLLAHFEIKNYALMEYLEKAVSRFIDKMKDRNRVQVEMLSFIRKQMRSNTIPDLKLLEEARQNLLKVAQDPYGKRAFIYLNVIDWIDGKIRGITTAEVIQERNRQLQD